MTAQRSLRHTLTVSATALAIMLLGPVVASPTVPTAGGTLLADALAGGFGRVHLEAQTEPTVVFLVRHAEREEDGTSDPPISEEGQARARLLAEMLRDAGLTHIHTTDYRRTRATGRPTAAAAGLDMELYDADDLAGFAARLRSMPGRHLVLGHSNTTPQLVEALGGDPGDAIDELEYDRLYIVTLTAEGPSTVLLRFGERYGG
jgi:phosphohistidine phosphatase SixA